MIEMNLKIRTMRSRYLCTLLASSELPNYDVDRFEHVLGTKQSMRTCSCCLASFNLWLSLGELIRRHIHLNIVWFSSEAWVLFLKSKAYQTENWHVMRNNILWKKTTKKKKKKKKKKPTHTHTHTHTNTCHNVRKRIFGDVRPPTKIQISLCIRAVWSEHSLAAVWIGKDVKLHHADKEGWSEYLTAQIFFLLLFLFCFFFFFFFCCFFFFSLFFLIIRISCNLAEPLLMISEFNSFGTKCQTTFVVCFFYLNKLSFGKTFICTVKRLNAKQRRSRWDGSLSRLIWIYAVCNNLLLSPVDVKELDW